MNELASNSVERIEKLEGLLDEVESYLPRSAMIYNVIKLKLVLVDKPNKKLKIKIFTFSSEGLMAMITIRGLPQTILVIFTPTSPSPQFLNWLQNTIDWSIPNQFEGVETPIATFITTICDTRARLVLHDPIELHYMPIEKALRLSPASASKNTGVNLFIGSLDPKDALEIDSVWPASSPGTLEMLFTSIELVGSGGVRILNVNNNNETEGVGTKEADLVSWAVSLPFGSIHALHTKKEYSGRGFAKMSMQSVSKTVAEMGRIPVTQIYKRNDASLHLNSRIGYIYSHDINLMHYYPN